MIKRVDEGDGGEPIFYRNEGKRYENAEKFYEDDGFSGDVCGSPGGAVPDPDTAAFRSASDDADIRSGADRLCAGLEIWDCFCGGMDFNGSGRRACIFTV